MNYYQTSYFNKHLKPNNMNSKKMYRIELANSNGLAKEMAMLAALSNGSKYIPLKDIEAVAKTELIRYPSLYDGISINPIGENCLTIDKGVENLLVLTEVEIMELVDEEFSGVPTIDQYLKPQGLADNSNHELLN